MARYGRQELVGVGGWLAVFVVTLILNTLVGLIAWGGVLYAQNSPQARAFVVTVAAVGFVRCFVYGALAWLLLARRRHGTVRLVIGGLWFIALSTPLTQWLASELLLARSTGAGGIALGGAMSPLGYATIWTLYLLRSERVANTYRQPADDLAAIFD